MNPVAAANVIGGEKTHAGVVFPLTGDMETDAISGVLAVFNAVFAGAGLTSQLRVCEYMTKRCRDNLDQYQQVTPKSAGQLSQHPTNPPSINPIPYPVWQDGGIGKGAYQTVDQLRERLGLPKP